MHSLRRLVQFSSSCAGWAAFMSFSLLASAQSTSPNEWTWVGGSKMGSAYYAIPAVYGALGNFAPGNSPGGRHGPTTWADRNGHLWLFGGSSWDNNSNGQSFNDMWEFDPATSEWAWVGGSNAPVNNSSSCALSGVQGTQGVAASGNTPSARSDAASWTDATGHLWLFGGSDCNGREPNDLWEFDPATKDWAWIGGTTTNDQPGVYGTLGKPSAGNVPGGRAGAATWTDLSGQLWMFGGGGFDSNKVSGYLNDLWRFDPSTGAWTWISGNSTVPQSLEGWPGVYGTLGTPAQGNAPGGRSDGIGWSDSAGRLWLFGGTNSDPNSSQGILNDLWVFDPAASTWTWMNGKNSIGTDCSQFTAGITICGQPGVYGTIGIPDPANTPGARHSSGFWTENTGRFWLFGGDGFDGNGTENGWLGDLWAFDPTTDQWTWMGGSSGLNCPGGTCTQVGTYGTLGIPAASNYPGSRNSASSWTDSNGNFWMYGGIGFDSTSNEDFLDDLWVYQPSDSVNVPKPDFNLVASPSSLSLNAGQSGSSTVSVLITGGFNTVVSFTCSGLPAGASCSFSPSAITPSVTTRTSLTISTSAAAQAKPRDMRPLYPVSALAVILCCLGLRRSRQLQFMLLMATIFSALTACGGGSGGSGSGGGGGLSTSTVTVTGTSGSVQHSVTISLTVK